MSKIEWTPVAERMPEEGRPVWLYEAGRGIWVGAVADAGDGDGWLWGNTYGSHYWDGQAWGCHENETDDDYQPTHWAELPLPPAAPDTRSPT